MDTSLLTSLWERPNTKPAGVTIFVPFYEFAFFPEYNILFGAGLGFHQDASQLF
jgi:hypothetical protein